MSSILKQIDDFEKDCAAKGHYLKPMQNFKKNGNKVLYCQACGVIKEIIENPLDKERNK
jgi:hypothetical protein